MASGPPPAPSRYGDPLVPAYGERTSVRRPQTWLVKDCNGERLEIIADDISHSKDTLTFALKGQVIACINGWLWYRLDVSDLPKT